MKKIWIDTDPGVDDTLAIAMLLEAPEIEIIGVSTIFGNVTVDLTTRNAKLLLEAAGMENIPLARGASYPLCVPLDTSPFVHGENGLGNMPLPEPVMAEQTVSAPQAIIDAIKANPHEITLFPIGPLTNIAMAYLLDPNIATLVKKVVIMGGAVHCPGNITPAAEANFFHDPHAAQITIAAGWPIALAGLDVCNQAMVPNDMMKRICAASKPLAPFISGALPFYQDFLKTFGIYDRVDFPDTLAAAYLLQPDLFTIERTPIFVETEGSCMGQSLPVPLGKWYEDRQDKRRFKADEHLGMVDVMAEVDVNGFLKLIEKLLFL
jgi:uridine nucleosidase